MLLLHSFYLYTCCKLQNIVNFLSIMNIISTSYVFMLVVNVICWMNEAEYMINFFNSEIEVHHEIWNFI
jgi:hypothetical protein